MALQSSGLIRLSQIQTEFGGSNPISLSEYYRNGSYVTSNNTSVPTSGAISLDDFYNGAKQFSFTISSNTQEANLSTLATAAGWDGVAPVVATVASGVYLWSDDTTIPGLLINVANSTVTNNGYIIGKGGAGGSSGGDGGPAISNTANNVTITNESGAYIAGGGGGGGGTYMAAATSTFMGGGGGGAGGGSGGSLYAINDTYYWVLDAGVALGGAIGTAGVNAPRTLRRRRIFDNADYGTSTGAVGGSGGGAGGGGGTGDINNYSGGGSGGRVLPGSGGAGSTGGGGAGGAADAAGTVGETQTGNFNGAGGGGGGWGAAGGAGGGGFPGGAGGAAISGNSTSLTNNGTIYGSTV